MAGTRQSKWSVALWLVGLAVLGAVMHWAYVYAWWIYPDLSQDQRTESFDRAFIAWGAVPARLERGGMTLLARSDVARVGASQCVRESHCSQSFLGDRRGVGCSYVFVTFNCIYAVGTTDGGRAAAFATLHSNRKYSIGVNLPDSPKPLEVVHPSFASEYDDLCKLDVNCKPGPPPGTQASAAARKAAEAPASPSADAASCNGGRADIVGKAETCLDPGDPARREFRDCNDGFCGPPMVALPKGRGLRGSSAADIARLRQDNPRSDEGTYRSETPQREVAIGYPLAVGKFEITFDEWEACLADGSCKRLPRDPTYPTRHARPVVHISWNEITSEFLPWLNRKLGLSGPGAYRLLTEAEWEYAARAGTTTRYAFGDLISTDQANFYASFSVAVGSFPPNAFGVHDMHGNVDEWVQDCYENGYDKAPLDGAALDMPNCSSRVYRGGTWNDVPRHLRSAHRSPKDPKEGLNRGFRVARTLVVR